MADNMNLQSAQVIAKIFGVTPVQVENLRRQKVIEGIGSPKQYDLLPTIQAYIKHLQSGVQFHAAAAVVRVPYPESVFRLPRHCTSAIARSEF